MYVTYKTAYLMVAILTHRSILQIHKGPFHQASQSLGPFPQGSFHKTSLVYPSS